MILTITKAEIQSIKHYLQLMWLYMVWFTVQ